MTAKLEITVGLTDEQITAIDDWIANIIWWDIKERGEAIPKLVEIGLEDIEDDVRIRSPATGSRFGNNTISVSLDSACTSRLNRLLLLGVFDTAADAISGLLDIGLNADLSLPPPLRDESFFDG